MIPLVEVRLASTSFILAFLSRLDQRATEGVFPTEDAQNLYKRVAKFLVDKIDIRTLGSEDVDGHSHAKASNLGLLWHGLEEEPEPAPLSRSSVVTPQILAVVYFNPESHHSRRRPNDGCSLPENLFPCSCNRGAQVPFALAPISTRFD